MTKVLLTKLAATAAVLLLLTGQLVADDKSVLLQDDFSTLDPGWDNGNKALQVENHKLVQQLPNKETVYVNFYKGDVFDDADISINVRKAKGGDSSECTGLAFWATNYDNDYEVRIDESGELAVARYSNGRLLFPVTWRDSDLVKKGLDTDTTIRVVTKGNTGTVYLNGKQAITFKGQPPDGGGFIGVVGSSSGKSPYAWEFSNLAVKKPTP
jgi:hypothetical protein